MNYQKTTGSKNTPTLECTNPRRNTWVFRCNYESTDNEQATYYEAQFDHEPTETEQRQIAADVINQWVQETILNGFKWKGYTVWLTSTNQQNYKAAADTAYQTDGKNLPFTAKFSDAENNDVFYTFETVKEITQFAFDVQQFINETVQEGWNKKQQI